MLETPLETGRTLKAAGPAVAADHLSRIYGEGEAEVRVLRDVEIAFHPATFTAVMGPSGSGKSTLMHILAGLDRPTSGSVTIDGIELNGLNDKKLTLLRRQKIGFVFQFFNLLPTRDQIRWIVRWESVITAAIGAVLGPVVSIALAAVVTTGLASQGIVFVLPIGSLLIWLVVAVISGIIAAAFPARRAAHLGILQAVGYE
jgi:hypothetical protein